MGSRCHAVALAFAVLLAPQSLRAQECTPEESGCPAGTCPLNNLPYEEFVGTPSSAPSVPSATRPVRRDGAYDIPPVSERPFDPDSGDKILVRRFLVENVSANPHTGITQESVQAVADAAFRRQAGGAEELRMTVGQMVRVADEVTTFYRNSGYLVAKAFIPVQTLGDEAVVRLSVLEGRVAEVAVENAKDYSASLLRRPSVRLIGAPPTRESVESALLYTQDYPGLRLFGTFRPGAQVGETRLVLQVQDEDRFEFSAGADNFGTDFTGVYRLRADASWNNPVGLGDQLSLTLLQSLAPQNTTYGSLGYLVPLGLRGLNGRIAASQNAFVVDEPPFDVLQLEGTITTFEAGLDWRFKRFRLFNAQAGLSFANKKSELTAVGSTTVTDDDFNVVTVNAGLDRTDTRFRGVDNLGFILRQGAGGEFTSAGSFATDFTIYGVNYLRLQALSETQFAILRVNTQFTDQPISPIEQFTLAGPDKVRGYPVGQALRDTGQFLSLEYQVQAPAQSQGPFGRQWRDLLKFALFADYAHGKSSDVEDGDVLSGAGAGVIFEVPGSFLAQLQGATALSSVAASDGDDVRFYANFSFRF